MINNPKIVIRKSYLTYFGKSLGISIHIPHFESILYKGARKNDTKKTMIRKNKDNSLFPLYIRKIDISTSMMANPVIIFFCLSLIILCEFFYLNLWKFSPRFISNLIIPIIDLLLYIRNQTAH